MDTRTPARLELPIFALRAAFDAAHARGPVVVSSPTGSGKSTEVPRWCEGPVLVVEPRRIACRSLAVRVAELEGARVGDGVGYVVRDEHVARADTRIVFATPGVVLRSDALLARAGTVVLDELHERSLDVDLLLALLLDRRRTTVSPPRLVVMSATLDGDRVATHIGGEHLAAEGRAFPVDVRYSALGDVSPDGDGLASRVRRAVDEAASDPGDVLVFLPGKAEIDACAVALRGVAANVLALHGGLTLDDQRRAFESTPRKKIILATNVAETSLTIPGIGVVIDSGLVRQTRYHDGRGYLTLGAIAADSAQQRAGRAGRTGPGICYRMWGAAMRLAPTTPPEIARESLVPLVLTAAAWGKQPEDLPFLDAPKPYALDAARLDLAAWGALDARGALTVGGEALFAMPLDADLARLLEAARMRGPACLSDAIDLVSALAVARPMFLPGPAPEDPHDDLRLGGCDATALVRAVRIGTPESHRVSGFVVAEARRIRARLRTLHKLGAGALDDATPVDRDGLVAAALEADSRVAYVARPRGRETFFSNGGTEIELARESAVRNVRDVEAVVVFASRAFGTGRETRLLMTCATPVSIRVLARAGLGRDRLGAVRLEGKRAVASVERVYAKRVLESRDEVPTGDVARAAIAELFLRGSLFRPSLTTARERLAMTTLAAKLGARGHRAGVPGLAVPLPLEAWTLARLEALGVESGDDLALLSASDLLPPEVPFEVRAFLEKDFPRVVNVGDAVYETDYDLDRNQVLLRMKKGSRHEPPPLSYLPRFAGFRIVVEGPRGITTLRERG